jgi:hypothetical protein
MDSLPTEILGLVLRFNVDMCRHDKNLVLPLRLVCKAFDAALKPYIFKTVQLEFSRFLKDATPNTDSLARVGHLCGAVYMDMMVVRDEGMVSLGQLRWLLHPHTGDLGSKDWNGTGYTRVCFPVKAQQSSA